MRLYALAEKQCQSAFPPAPSIDIMRIFAEKAQTAEK